MNIVVAAPPDNVLGVVLFGSQARGDATPHSDVDVCVFYRALTPETLDASRVNRLPYLRCEVPIEISAYDEKTASTMASSGSLFLWHLKLEGEIQFERSGYASSLLASLLPPPDLQEELDIHVQIFELIQNRRLEGELADPFDLAALHTILRNVSILLCANAGRYRFGRSNAFGLATELYGDLGVSPSMYERLMEHHLVYKRGAEAVSTVPVDLNEITRSVAVFLSNAR